MFLRAILAKLFVAKSPNFFSAMLAIYPEIVACVGRSSLRSLAVLAAVWKAKVAGSNPGCVMCHACFRKTHKLRTNRTNEYEDFTSFPTGTSWEVPLGSEPRKFFAKTRVRTCYGYAWFLKPISLRVQTWCRYSLWSASRVSWVRGQKTCGQHLALSGSRV